MRCLAFAPDLHWGVGAQTVQRPGALPPASRQYPQRRGWRLVLDPVVARYRDRPLRRYFRTDAAFAKPEIYDFPEAEGYAYAIHLPTNAVLREQIAHF